MLLLFEEEEQSIGRTLRRWSDNLRARQTAALSRHTAFMQGVADLVARGFDSLFGEKLISARAFLISVHLSCLSIILVATILAGHFLRLSDAVPPALMVLALAGLLYWLVRHKEFPRHPLSAVELVVCTGLMMGCIHVGYRFFRQSPLLSLESAALDSILPICGVLAAIASDFIFIAVTRRVLRLCSEVNNSAGIAALLAINWAASLLLVALPFRFSGATSIDQVLPRILEYYSVPWFEIWPFVGLSNILDVFVASSVFVLGLILLVHRLLWPIVNRPFYAFATRTEFRRGLLFIFGIALLATGFGIAPSPWPVLRKLVVDQFVGG